MWRPIAKNGGKWELFLLRVINWNRRKLTGFDDWVVSAYCVTKCVIYEVCFAWYFYLPAIYEETFCFGVLEWPSILGIIKLPPGTTISVYSIFTILSLYKYNEIL